MNLEDIFTDVALEKVEQKPTGTVRTPVNSYTKLFGQNVPKEETAAPRQKRNKERKVIKGGKQKLKVKRSAKHQKQQIMTDQEREGKKVLFKADPGMGKTSLMKKVTYDWVKGIFTVFAIVFFVSVKLVKPGAPIENIIIDQNPKLKGLKVSPHKLRALRGNFGNQCLIILDGFDENDSNRGKILKILRGEELLACSVIVTTRPHDEGDISQHFQIVCEVCGFQKDCPSQFISKRLKDKTKTTDVLKFYRRNFVKIGSEQFSPLILLFVCSLVDVDSIDLSANNVVLGEIYFRIVRRIYVTYLKKRKGDEACNSSKFLDVVKKMGKLAWETLIEHRNLRQKSDIACQIDQDVFKYGYLIGYEDDRLNCDETADIFVTFFHATVEEFFASFHFVDNLSKGTTVENLFTGCKKPIFMINRLFLSFCLWFLYSDQQYLSVKDKALAQSNLAAYVTQVVDVPQLHFPETTDNYLALNLAAAFKSNDEIAQRFLKHVLSCFQRTRQILLDSTDPIRWAIESLSHLLQKVFLVRIVGYKYYRFGLAIDMWRVPEVSSTEFSLVIPYREKRLIKEVLPYFKKLSRKVSLYVVIMSQCSRTLDSATERLGRIRARRFITEQCCRFQLFY